MFSLVWKSEKEKGNYNIGAKYEDALQHSLQTTVMCRGSRSLGLKGFGVESLSVALALLLQLL